MVTNSENVNEIDETEELLEENKALRANEIIKNSVIASMGVGAIPIPVVDVVGLTGIQLNMIHNLCELYEQEFSKTLGKSFVASLAGSLGAVPLAATMASLIKAIPFVGSSVGMVSMPVIGGSSTYAIGKVFVQHFESGGTFLDFNPSKVKEYLKEQFSNGKDVAQNLNTENNTESVKN